MVKIKTLARSEKDGERETKLDIFRVQRNPNPNLHPFQKAKEYQRAMVSAKLEKIFAKPFLGVLSGHSDGISCMSKSSTSLVNILSGSFDGEIKYWDMSQRRSIFSLNAHPKHVKGLCFSDTSEYILSCGDDQNIAMYSIDNAINAKKNTEIQSVNKFYSKTPLTSIDHSYSEKLFATSGNVVAVWSYERSNPLTTFEWGAASINKVKFNPSQNNILVATGIDRTVALYDIRAATPLTKISLQNKSMCVAWNPMEPYNFTCGNDDSNCYSFDMRNMDHIKLIHKDHIQAVMDIDYSPTGNEFVTGSYDKTVRIFKSNEGRSREVYHGQRMQKVFCVQYTQDNHYILSGSEDFNIRIWKSNASEPIGPISQRHKTKLQYREKLKERYGNNKEIKRILRHRHLPKYILNTNRKKQIMKESKYRKIKNQEVHNPDFQKPKPEREAKIMEIIE